MSFMTFNQMTLSRVNYIIPCLLVKIVEWFKFLLFYGVYICPAWLVLKFPLLILVNKVVKSFSFKAGIKVHCLSSVHTNAREDVQVCIELMCSNQDMQKNTFDLFSNLVTHFTISAITSTCSWNLRTPPSYLQFCRILKT